MSLYWVPQNYSVCWGFEAAASYGGEVDGTIPFGYNLVFRPTGRQNMMRYYHAVDSAVVADDTLTRLPHRTTEQRQEVRGSIEYVIADGRFLPMCVGECAEGGDGTKTHTITPTKTLSSASIDHKHYDTGGLTATYTGIKIESWTLSGAVDRALSLRADWRAQDVTNTASAVAGAVPAVAPFEWYDVDFTAGGVPLDLANRYVTGFNLTGTRPLNPLWQMEDAATRTLYAIAEGQEVLTGRFDLNPTDTDEFDAWALAAELTTDPVITYTRTAGTDLMVITLEDVYLDEWSQPEDLAQAVTPTSLTFTFEDIGIVISNTTDWTEWD